MMENSNERNEECHVESGASKDKPRKPRGPSKGLKSIPGLHRTLEWDEAGRPVGRWLTDYKKHVGEISRSKVSILYSDWKSVPQGVQDTLWEDTKREFNIEESEAKKKKVLTLAATRWRDFKTRLVSGHITCTRPLKKNERRPPYETYSAFITKDIWDEFVKDRADEKFKERSEKARASQACNEYPHRMGQKSYAEKEPEWRNRGLLPSQEASSSSYAIANLPSRAQAWLLARSKEDLKGGMYVPDENVQRVKAEIDAWRKKEKDGEFVPSRQDDALSRALKKKDRFGRVLAVGGRVGVNTVWGPPNRKGGTYHSKNLVKVEDLEAFEERVTERARKQTMEEVYSKFGEMMKEQFIQWAQAMNMQIPEHMMVKASENISPSSNHHTFPSSCHSGGVNESDEVEDPFQNLKESSNCDLAILVEGKKIVVGEGFVVTCFIPKDPVNNVKVSVDRCLDGCEDAPVPIPTDFIHYMSQSIGAFLEWPKSLVMLDTHKDDMHCAISPTKRRKESEVGSGPGTEESSLVPKRNNLVDMALENAKPECQEMYKLVSRLREGEDYTLSTSAWVFKYESEEGKEIHIGYDDVTQLLTGAWLNAPILQIIALDLNDWADKASVDSIGFMCPNMISATVIQFDPDASCRYMQQAIRKQERKRFILCPYHERNHWILFVLCPARREVYMFDPIQKQRRKLAIRSQLDTAFQTYRYSLGHSSGYKLTWIQGKCAQQPGGRECGYYVMRYMVEIAEEYNASENLVEDYSRTAPYSDEEIQNIKERFATYFVGSINETRC